MEVDRLKNVSEDIVVDNLPGELYYNYLYESIATKMVDIYSRYFAYQAPGQLTKWGFTMSVNVAHNLTYEGDEQFETFTVRFPKRGRYSPMYMSTFGPYYPFPREIKIRCKMDEKDKIGVHFYNAPIAICDVYGRVGMKRMHEAVEYLYKKVIQQAKKGKSLGKMNKEPMYPELWYSCKSC